MPIVGTYRDKGTIVLGKVERGEGRKGQGLVLMPNRVPVMLEQLWTDDGQEVTSVRAGECVSIKLKGIDLEDINQGFVLSDLLNPCNTGTVFDAQMTILEHGRIISAGYSAIIHIHCATEDVSVRSLLWTIDKRTGEKTERLPRFVRQKQVVILRLECAGVISLEPYETLPQLGRFTLRDEDQTIAVGKVLKIIK